MKYKKWLILSCLLLDTVFISGCHVQGNERSNNQESSQQETGMKQKEISKGVLESFEKTLSYYPTSNIDDLLNEDGKKQAILDMRINDDSSGKDSFLYSKGMTLYIDTKTKQGHGYYFERKYYDGPADKDKKTKYPVIYDKGIHLKQSTGNLELDRKIENFKFLFQYAGFGDLSKKKLLEADYNPEVPLFSAEYQLSNEDSVVKEIRKNCKIDYEGSPVLMLDGRGNYENAPISNFDYRHVDVYFSHNPRHSVDSSIDYTDDVIGEDDY